MLFHRAGPAEGPPACPARVFSRYAPRAPAGASTPEGPARLISELGEDGVARDGLLGGLALRKLRLLGVVVDGVLGLPLGLEPLHDGLHLPAELVREPAEDAVAPPDLQARDA